MSQHPFDRQAPSQRGAEGNQERDRAEEEARAEALAETQQQVLSWMAEAQAADLLQQMVEEEAEFGWYPFNDPGLYY